MKNVPAKKAALGVCRKGILEHADEHRSPPAARGLTGLARGARQRTEVYGGPLAHWPTGPLAHCTTNVALLLGARRFPAGSPACGAKDSSPGREPGVVARYDGSPACGAKEKPTRHALRRCAATRNHTRAFHSAGVFCRPASGAEHRALANPGLASWATICRPAERGFPRRTLVFRALESAHIAAALGITNLLRRR